MALLKDTLITGNLRVTDTTLTDTLQADTIKVNQSSTSDTKTAGTSGQVLMTNGESAYWGTVASSDVNVTQTATTTSANYEVLLSGTADNTTRTEGARKNSNLTFNPSTGNLQTTQLNGVTVGSSPKFTDTTYSSKAAASGGTDVSLVTTGEKYTWNNKGTGTITKVGNTTSGTVTVSSANNTASFGSAVTIGSVGGVDLKFTMPANPNSDTKVTQTVTGSSNTSWRPLLLGYSYSDEATFAPTTVTNTTLASHLGKFAPKTGILGIVGLNKMTTSGTVETGSNTTVWNTNGGTTSLSGYLTSHQAVSSNNNTATWGSTVTVGKVGSTDLKFTMPSNPNTNTTYTFAEGSTDGAFSVTPSGGSATPVSVHGVVTSSNITNYTGNAKLFHGICNTAAATVAKVVECEDFKSTDLVRGVAILVTFDVANTGAVDSLTMNVNSTGAFPIKKNYNVIIGNLASAGEIRASTYLCTFYDKDDYKFWVISGLDYNSTYYAAGLSVYERRYIHGTDTPLYRYKICGMDATGKLVPLTITNQTSATIVSKTPTNVGFSISRGLFYYGATTNITTATAVTGTQVLWEFAYITTPQYTFNAAIATYSDVYLKGTAYGDIFTLDTTSNTSWYVQVKHGSAAATYNNVFESGAYYMYVGSSYSTANYFQISVSNPVFYFDGEKLNNIPVSNLLNGTSTQFVKGDGSFDSNSYLPENQAILSRMQDDATHRTVTDTDKTNWNNKQSTLISGSNIKTINNTSLLGSGNILIPSGKSAYEIWLDAGNTGTTSDFLESLKGNSGYSGAAGELQVVNDLTTGGATAALSAEMGKLLADAIGAPTLINLNEITIISNGYAISSTTKLWISRSDSKYILIPVENFYKVVVTANSSGVSALAWLKDTPTPVEGETPNYSEGTSLWLQQANTIETYTVPTDAKFLYSFVTVRYPAKVIGIKYNTTYNKNQFEPNLKTYSPITGSYINVTTYKWDNQNSTWSHIMIPNANYQSVTVKSNSSYGSRIAFLTNNDETSGSTPSYAENTSLYKSESGETNNYLIPSSTNWIYIYTGVDYGHSPESVVFYTDDSNSVNSIINTSSENDFEIVDENKNPIVIFNNGHIKTLKFDSSKLVKTSNYTRRNFFSYNVNCTNFLTTNFTASSINYYDPIALYEDNAILYLPASYSNQGPKTKLIIYCKEGSTYMTENHDSILTNPEATRYFLYQGYAILAADGVPDGWKEALKIGERAVGNYVAVQSTLRAFEYVKNNYNIDCDNVFIFGYSQGGMYAENVIDNTDLPIRAAVLLSPALSMRYHQWDAPTSQTIDGTSYTKGARLNIARIFNFPEVTTNAQLLALEYDPDKVCGYDPWVRNVDNPYDGFIKGTSVGTELWGLPSGTSLDSITMKKYTKCPTKIWVAENDNVLGVDITKVFVKAIRNTGQVADLQLFSTGEHHIQNYQTAIRTFVENGENVSLLPLYLDMAAWYYNFGGLELK